MECRITIAVSLSLVLFSLSLSCVCVCVRARTRACVCLFEWFSADTGVALVHLECTMVIAFSLSPLSLSLSPGAVCSPFPLITYQTVMYDEGRLIHFWSRCQDDYHPLSFLGLATSRRTTIRGMSELPMTDFSSRLKWSPPETVSRKKSGKSFLSKKLKSANYESNNGDVLPFVLSWSTISAS